jgi:hypothetical protein
MASEEKTKKDYKKPEITQVKLEIDEVVLQACKHFAGDSTGKGNKSCGTNSCKLTFGS